MILDGKKTWEIRGSPTGIRETIGLIASGSGTVVGVCDLVDCVGPLTATSFRKNAERAGLRPNDARLGWYRTTYAWVLANPRYLLKPVAYEHPPGAVIWVKLQAALQHQIHSAL
jgi:hypothetical protein